MPFVACSCANISSCCLFRKKKNRSGRSWKKSWRRITARSQRLRPNWLRISCVLWKSRERSTRSAWSWSRTGRSSRRRSRKSSSARASPGPSSPSPWRPQNKTAPPSSAGHPPPPIQLLFLLLLIIQPHSSSSSVERSLRFGSAERRGGATSVLTRSLPALKRRQLFTLEGPSPPPPHPHPAAQMTLVLLFFLFCFVCFIF